MTEVGAYTREDFVSDQDVRWCPGCGDYAILRTVQKVLPEIGVAKENIVFVSGIGCSSRFPFYVDTFGFHTLHGRAPTIASGIKSVNPDLDVWLITGDGDGLSIGGNHMLHLLRRNLRIKVLLFNNRIYGLTKGQYSPTSLEGQVTKSSPQGAIDYPVQPCAFALGAEATFIARTADNQLAHMEETIRQASKHDGTAFVEIMQNCVIFNHGTWDGVTAKANRNDQQLLCEAGQPLRYGKDNEYGITAKNFALEPATVGENGVSEDDVLIHDPGREDPALAYALARLGFDGKGPVPLGVLRQISRPNYETQLEEKSTAAAAAQPSLTDMFNGFGKANTWEVN